MKKTFTDECLAPHEMRTIADELEAMPDGDQLFRYLGFKPLRPDGLCSKCGHYGTADHDCVEDRG